MGPGRQGSRAIQPQTERGEGGAVSQFEHEGERQASSAISPQSVSGEWRPGSDLDRRRLVRGHACM